MIRNADPKGVPASVLDRLVDEAPDRTTEPHPLRVVGIRRLRESVRNELSRLLNTRSSVEWDRWHERERTVLDYGIPDFTWMSPASFQDRERLAVMIAQCVETFEPRLRGARARVVPAPSPRTVRIVIEGRLMAGGVNEPVAFPLTLGETGEMYLEDEDG